MREISPLKKKSLELSLTDMTSYRTAKRHGHGLGDRMRLRRRTALGTVFENS